MNSKDFHFFLALRKNVIETQAGQVIIDMMREYCEDVANTKLDALEIKGMQRLIKYVRDAKLRYEEEKDKN